VEVRARKKLRTGRGMQEPTTTVYDRYIREIPDFPKPGIGFKDVTPLLADGKVFAESVEDLARLCEEEGLEPERIACPEARGFIFGAALAYRLGIGLVPIRKPGKLPYTTSQVEYALEYGTDKVEMHVDGVTSGQQVLVVDDLLATGGTTAACVDLIRQAGARVVGCAFLVELTFLNGRQKLEGMPVLSLVRY
jgi:adenine phosphoribosyltransferase